ncbi:hypothetical protein H0G86_009096 [Trichoderma simmonsii]|uniref:Uncharacterized protein n=1 Tax=Trichoderma simmonsii TaxID=1491479 RepID=A0A8G0PK00_9HYPO|nr:hypothetical protein H0G86_009096 [Trichoderma simmonsii]
MPAAAHSLSNEERSSRLGRDAVRPGGVFLRSRKRKSEIEVECRVSGRSRGRAQGRRREVAREGEQTEYNLAMMRKNTNEIHSGEMQLVNEDEAEPSARAVGPKMD